MCGKHESLFVQTGTVKIHNKTHINDFYCVDFCPKKSEVMCAKYSNQTHMLREIGRYL